MKSNQFEVYKKREDVLMDKLYHVTIWTYSGGWPRKPFCTLFNITSYKSSIIRRAYIMIGTTTQMIT